MTDSTIDDKPGDGGFDVGSSADELFGEIEEEPLEADVDRSDEDGDETGTEHEGEPADEDDTGVEDQTAAAVFGQLKNEVVADGADGVLEDETPEEIIAGADEPDPEPAEPIDDDLLADEDELADLLLTERTKGEEFLWVDSGSSTEDTGTEPDTAPGSDAKSQQGETSEVDLEAETAATPESIADENVDSGSNGRDSSHTDDAEAMDDRVDGGLEVTDERMDEGSDVDSPQDDSDVSETDGDTGGVIGWIKATIGRVF
ncbi:hypothetical protein EA462_05815 [Natrarchaeobius halalkaliphilus]|uniref:Uncharacterized protein n=1 Tax=Natrarchaeobius halalkaliphilus TaxID=1679091 RepID=A0A3N6LPP4_9EURY|nr:hypothetical protein [Natrarchaeobius halalkaliphilus]RQG91478.1 hypothetical protein EA462_05815 [Natrarchaeobius halalkaliphilus]